MSKSSPKQLYAQLKEWLPTLKHKRKDTSKSSGQRYQGNKSQSRMEHYKKQGGR